MARFSAVLFAAAALFAGTQAAATLRAEICADGTVACGFDLLNKYGHTIEELQALTPGGLKPWDSLFLCGEDNKIDSYVDTCNAGKCVGDHVRPGYEDAFCVVE